MVPEGWSQSVGVETKVIVNALGSVTSMVVLGNKHPLLSAPDSWYDPAIKLEMSSLLEENPFGPVQL